MTLRFTLLWILVCGAGCALRQRHEITLESLLHEMVDREAITRLPDPAYRTLQASSYDRKSVAKDKPGWFANVDTGQYIRAEVKDGRKESVMLDVQGPGAIVRWWAGGTTPEKGPPGTIRIYLDGEAKPAFEGLMDTLVSPDWKVGPPLAATRCIGRNFYLPIPFAKSCKITYDRPGIPETNDWANNAHWYVIDYRMYEAGTRVRSFSMEELESATSAIGEAQKQLVSRTDSLFETARFVEGVSPEGRSAENSLEPGDAHTIEWDVGRFVGRPTGGMSALSPLEVQVSAEDLVQALRSIILVLRFDGEETVWCPVGDFFGTGVGLNPYSDWSRKVTKKAVLVSNWLMPFQTRCEASLVNLGSHRAEVALFAPCAPYTWTDRSMHFHATWRQEHNIETKKEDGIDWNYVSIEGQGVYVGDTLALHNGAGPWWGEGDEKIFVDGEGFPSHFGTGTEDYYGYSYGDRGTFFESPFHSEPRWEGNNRAGFVTNTRTRSLDAIPFQKRLDFDMEIWHWSKTRVTYAATTYFYARPGAKTNRPPQIEEARRSIDELRNREKGVLEGEELQILAKSGGETELQYDGRWSSSAQLWWRDAKVGERLDLEVPVATAGRFKLLLRYTTAFDYGGVQISLDGEKLGKPLDFYSKAVEVHDADLGVRELKVGSHTLSFEIVGSNPDAKPRHMVGLDFLKVILEAK